MTVAVDHAGRAAAPNPRRAEPDAGGPVATRRLDAVVAHRCSSRLLSIEAELVGVARHPGLPGCGVAYMIARRAGELWEVAEASDPDRAAARVGLDLVLHPERRARHAAHEAAARERFAAAAARAGELDTGASRADLAAGFDAVFDAYADFLAAYRMTNERFWSAARSWLLDELARAGGEPELLSDLLWLDMTDTDTARAARAWEALVRGADLHSGHALAEAVARHARGFGHLFGDQVFGEIDVAARLWRELRDGQVATGYRASEIAARSERRARTLAGLALDATARAALDAARELALQRLRMREHMLRCNALTRGMFDAIADRIGLGAVDRPLLRQLSRRDITDGLAGAPTVSAAALVQRRRSAICELVAGEVRVWSIAHAAGAAAPPRRLVGQVVHAGARVVGRAVRAARAADIEPARAAAGPGPHILVVPMLQPAMIVAAASFAGVLAAEGGLLSHAAMLAREYRIPCITGLGALDELVETGQRIAFDPARGIAELEPPCDGEPGAAPEPAPSVSARCVAWTHLGGAGELDAQRFGGKAYALRRMFAALPIPDGLCVSSQATRQIADWDALCGQLFGAPDRDELGGGELRLVERWFAQIAERWRPPERLLSALATLGPCVVRSSSAEEDRPGASTAGLLSSVAIARPAIELAPAVAEVLRSALAPAYLRYRRDRGWPGPPPCPALLIQRRVACAASGVLSTWRPPGAQAGWMTLGVARGFAGGESPRQLVLGVDPDGAAIERYHGGDADGAAPIERCLEAHGLCRASVRELCALALPMRRAGVERFELEWCLDLAGRPFVVQIRDRRSELP